MKIPIDGVQAFVEIVETGGFSKAATQLGITQTALTRRMQRLEGFVGVRLLDRTNRAVALTALGKEFLPQARRLIEDLVNGLSNLRTVSRLERGDVTLAATQSVTTQHLPDIIGAYAAKYPSNNIKILERTGDLATEAVLQGQADFGITILAPTKHTGLDAEFLLQSPFALICHRSDRLGARPQIAWSELDTTRLITLGGASGNRQLIEESLARNGFSPRGRYVVESVASALALVRLNLGAAILPATSVQAEPDLKPVKLVHPEISRSIGLIKRRNATLTPAAEALYRTAQDCFAPRLQTGFEEPALASGLG